MKTLRFSLIIAMICIAGSAFSQEVKPSVREEAKPSEMETDAATSVYFVQVPHTKEQCMKSLESMKSKGDAVLSQFEYGCMSGDHTAYGFLKGSSEANIKQMLPTTELANAKIVKVKKFTVAEIESLHKDKPM